MQAHSIRVFTRLKTDITYCTDKSSRLTLWSRLFFSVLYTNAQASFDGRLHGLPSHEMQAVLVNPRPAHVMHLPFVPTMISFTPFPAHFGHGFSMKTPLHFGQGRISAPELKMVRNIDFEFLAASFFAYAFALLKSPFEANPAAHTQ